MLLKIKNFQRTLYKKKNKNSSFYKKYAINLGMKNKLHYSLNDKSLIISKANINSSKNEVKTQILNNQKKTCPKFSIPFLNFICPKCMSHSTGLREIKTPEYHLKNQYPEKESNIFKSSTILSQIFPKHFSISIK